MIATDGSEAAIEATRRAVSLLRDDAEIVLLAVVPQKEDPMETAGGIEGPALTEDEAEREYREHLAEGNEALARTAKVLGVDADMRLVPAEHEPGHAIVEFAKEAAPDLLVIGASDKNLLRRLFTGSVSDYVVHHAPCPVLVIRHDHG
jgi:nucleotide-binding universal stress UspA family protein